MRIELEKQTKHRYFLHVNGNNKKIICFKTGDHLIHMANNLGYSIRRSFYTYLNILHSEIGFSNRKIRVYAP